jgi:hypothetical protein
MGALLAGIGTAFGSLFTSMAAQLAAKFGLRTALIVVYVAAAASFLAVISAFVGGLSFVLPDMLATGLNYMPTSIAPCMSAILAAETAAYVYRQIVIVAAIKAKV